MWTFKKKWLMMQSTLRRLSQDLVNFAYLNTSLIVIWAIFISTTIFFYDVVNFDALLKNLI